MIKDDTLKEMLERLEAQGWEPVVCDTPVPVFADTPAPCGKPDLPGDTVQSWMSLPQSFLSMQAEFVVTVRGDSMVDADIDDGDAVKVVTDVTPRDGDIALVMVDGEVTLKCWFEDEDGHSWLLPQNEAYLPFQLDESQDVRVLGVVREIIKRAPRISYRKCQELVNKARRILEKPRRPSAQQVEQVVCGVAPLVTKGRQWYAVYRPLVTALAVTDGDYEGFVDVVRGAVPGHGHLPVSGELQRMCVQSFAKPVALWRPDNAPVRGKRYKEYLQIAQRTEELLEKLP